MGRGGTTEGTLPAGKNNSCPSLREGVRERQAGEEGCRWGRSLRKEWVMRVERLGGRCGGHRWQESFAVELMGSVEGRVDTEAGSKAQRSLMQLRGEALSSLAWSLTPAPVVRCTLGS